MACQRLFRTDQGPEFTGHALDLWAYRNGVQLKLIAPGSPTQSAFIESFNGKFRDECLNHHHGMAARLQRTSPAQRLAIAPAEFAAAHRHHANERSTEDIH